MSQAARLFFFVNKKEAKKTSSMRLGRAGALSVSGMRVTRLLQASE
ncbi:MAG: hypothetical protein IT555_00610 [Acetobacteraceae bacterium]|nr:hypothetical protein [Acetobacteraceae bacterium]